MTGTMSTEQPDLEQYPGYFPAAKPPFWTRTKVGIASGLLGLALGAGGASGEEPPKEEAGPDTETVQAMVDEAVAEETSELEDRLESTEEEVEEAEQQLERAEQQVERVQAKAEQAQRQAVRKAVTQERQRLASLAPAPAAAPEPAPEPEVQTFVGSGAGTDPQFGTCGEANDNGFGPYTNGVDPEYDWYDDRDGDGVVCES